MKHLLILFSICNFQCSNTNIQDNKIIGEWYCISNSVKLKYTFKENFEYNIDFNGNFNVNGLYTLDSDSNRIILYLENKPMLFSYSLLSDGLFLISYKDDYRRIDEILHLQKKKLSEKSIFKSKVTQKFVLPNNNKFNFVCYNHKYGKKEEYDDNGIPIIRISDSGVTKTIIAEDPINYIQGNLMFIVKDSLDKTKKIPFFRFNRYTGALNSLISQGFNLDSTYVCLYDFNQIGHNEISNIFNENISNNVLMFKMDKLKNLTYNPFTDSYLDK